MLKEQLHVAQKPGDLHRRWFSSEQFDLILWLGEDGAFAGFELCYDRKGRERSLLWRPASGFLHLALEDGEGRSGKHKATPILVADGRFDAKRIHAAFTREARSLPVDVANYVIGKLETHPDFAPDR